MKALASILVLALLHPISARAVDIKPLLGGWEWVSSKGGLLGANETPPPSGWSRVLYFLPDGSFTFWEIDSAASYLLKRGKYVAHEAGRQEQLEGGRRADLWLDMPGWSGMAMDHELVAFADENTMIMYPGGGGMWVSDMLTKRYRRDNVHSEPRESQPTSRWSTERPPRMRNGHHGGYWTELTPRFEELRSTMGPFSQWNDYAYPRSLLDSYLYTHNQIPSAVIGDFDGDSILDVTLQGRTGSPVPGGADTSKVVCLLSNRGSPRAVTFLREPTWSEEGRRMDTRAFQRPPSCLMLHPAGSPILDREWKRITLLTPAVLVARPSKDRAVYYFASGEMRQGWPVTSDEFTSDSLALIGAWRWTHSHGGLEGATIKPPRGTERILLFRPDGTYAEWVHDSARDSIHHSGKYTVNRQSAFSHHGEASFWVELLGWPPIGGGRQLVTFAGRDEIHLYPGGGNHDVNDALTRFYQRAKNWRDPAPAARTR